MKIFKFHSIRNRLNSWFLLITLVPLLLVLTLTYFQRVDVILSRTSDKLVAIRDLKVGQVSNWLEEREGDMKVISADNELKDLQYVINKTSFDSEDLEIFHKSRQLLQIYLDNYYSYKELFIINPLNGRILVSTIRANENSDKSSDEYFTAPMQSENMHIKDIYFSRTLSDYSMSYSIPIFSSDPSGEHIVGILVARIGLHNSLYNLLNDKVGLGTSGETLIVNKDVIALNELRWYDNTLVNLVIHAQPAVEAANGKTGIAITLDYRDEMVMAAYTFIPETGWGFICKQDMHELNTPIRDMVRSFILIFLITTVIIILLVTGISRSITKPIVELDKVAHKMREGDFNIRSTIMSKDEFGSLSLEFNNMADVLQSRLDIQSAIGRISDTMIGVTSMHEFGKTLLRQLMNITKSEMSVFYVLNEATSEFEHFTSIGSNEDMLRSFNAQNPEGEFGNMLSMKDIYYLQNIPEDTIFTYKTSAGDAKPKEIITIPVLVDTIVVAIISLININKFSHDAFEILKLSWQGINSSYSTLLASERTSILAEQLYRTNQDLESKSEELQEQAEELQRSSEELQEQNLFIESKNKEVEGANKLKSEFLSNMSHELRTPLNSVLSLTHVLSLQTKEKLSEKEYSYLEIIERNGKNLLKLVNDILDLSKIEAAKMEIFPTLFSLNMLCRQVRDSFDYLANEKGLKFIMNIEESLPLIETDEIRLQQVLINIIGNAIKFTENGTITCSVGFDTDNFSIIIADTGIGIEEKEIPFIFDEFRQADGSTTKQFEGTGLGLSIVRKLVEILTGRISVSSKLGKGTIVSLSLPLKWQGDDNIRMEIGEVKDYQGLGGKKILLVDDNDAVIKQIKALLEKEGLTVDVARPGKETLDYFKEMLPDGIIVSFTPDDDRFEIIESIRSTPKTAKIPIIVLAEKELPIKEIKRLNSNNIQQLLQKGELDANELLDEVKHLLSIDQRLAFKSNLKTSKVLVVEDNPDDLITIKAIIGDQLMVSSAIDGEQGCDLAMELLPNIVLLDISLPKKDGFEVLKFLRQHEETKAIPVIAVTASAMTHDKQLILEAGFDEFVAKPIDQEELLSKIFQLL